MTNAHVCDAAAADALWFADNSRRKYRIRPRFPGEFANYGLPDTVQGHTSLTVTLNLLPHHLARNPILLPFPDARPPNTDAVAHRLLRKFGVSIDVAALAKQLSGRCE